ncbi:MAG: FAD-dependent pyridine nucleotide-disulfide oxidoreductase [Clostridia bacterium]|jgi:ribulose 1,5-bisphosphate synthetase/thiazole synthase|nr:FAD-dependent pyridine nucleotide-disulfide oxidoreductase [Clostridia bacterium]
MERIYFERGLTMNHYMEAPKQIPVKAEVDVLVVGGGPAGFSAAISAARSGAKTMLIEQTGDVGGVATVGLMSHWTGNTKGGFFEEILDRSSDMPDDTESLGHNGSYRQIINPESLKTVMLQMLDEAGVILQLYTFASDAIVEEGILKGVITESKSGREAIYSKIVIDASGDGDVAAKAGAPFTKGREDDGKMQPMTLMFKVAGVDTSKAVFPGGFEENIEIPKGFIQNLGRENIPHPAGHVLLYRTTLPGVVTCNMTNCIGVDGTKAEDLTHAAFVCRSQIDSIIKFLRNYVPGYENCYVISSASMIGVRETRHFIGEYTLTKEDILEAKVFEDWVVTKAHFNFDVHNITGSGLDETGAQQHFTQEKGYTIPYGCFVPQKIDNLLLAGRNISGTHLAHSNYRVMPICVNMGQAAGIAAALCVKENVLPRNLSVTKIQEVLKTQGVQP